MTTKETIEELKSGNQRFVKGNLTHPSQSPHRRRELASGQSPKACILSCADSRVPPEIIFDQGLGDLFVLRVAGNVVNDMILGSLEYAVEHLKAALIVVLGHQKCGAVSATVSLAGKAAPGHIGSLTAAIQPAVDKVTNASGDIVEASIRENIKSMCVKVECAKGLLADAAQKGTIQIAGAYYHLDSGEVEWLR